MKIPILIPKIFDYPFTYETGDVNAKLGDFVQIPFGTKKIVGVVWNEFEKDNKKNFIIKKIISKLDIPPLNIETINFLNWFSRYNLVPRGMSLKLLLLNGNIAKDNLTKNFKLFDDDNYDLSFVISNRTLSSGQMQKISFIRALLANTELLLLDESTSNLDTETRDLIFSILKKEDITIINSTHNHDEFSYDNHVKIEYKGDLRNFTYIK